MPSLHAAKSGITRADKYAELGFRSQVQGAPTLNPADVIDRRAMRFLGEGAAWNHVAMEQAILDAGLRADDVSNVRTDVVIGSGGRPPAPSSMPPTPRAQGIERVGPFAVPKAISSDRLGYALHSFKIKGVNFSISSASATSNHASATPTRPCRSAAGRHLRRRLRGARLDPVGTVRRGGRDVVASATRRRRASRPYDVNRDGFSSPAAPAWWCWKNSAREARGARMYGEFVGYGATSDGSDMVAPFGEGAALHAMAVATVRRAGSTISIRMRPPRRPATRRRSMRFATSSATRTSARRFRRRNR